MTTGLLLDTHIVLWALRDDDRISPVRPQLVDPTRRVVVSAASVWEIAIKVGLGKLRAPDDVVEQIETAGFEQLSISASHASGVRDLPPHHRDPFDRLLVSQAAAEGLRLLTVDEKLARYDVEVRLLRS